MRFLHQCQGKNSQCSYVPIIEKILIIICLTYDLQVYIFQTNVIVTSDQWSYEEINNGI